MNQISTGDLLRKEVREQTKEGKIAKAQMLSGGLVDDQIVLRLFINQIQKPEIKSNVKNKFIKLNFFFFLIYRKGMVVVKIVFNWF